LHVARGVVGRDVQGVEIVEFGFHFGAVQDGESERDEEVLEFPLDARDGMQVAAARAGRGQGEIHPLGIEARAQGGFIELPLPGVERGFEAHGVHADRLESLGRLGGSDAREGTGRQFLDGFVKHVMEMLIVASGGGRLGADARIMEAWHSNSRLLSWKILFRSFVITRRWPKARWRRSPMRSSPSRWTAR